MKRATATLLLLCCVVSACCAPAGAPPAPVTGAALEPEDALASWNDGTAKQALLDFVSRTTTAGGPDYVPPAERIAVFDNDGTLWAEQPMYFQLAFTLDRIKTLAAQHPEWKSTAPFKAVLEGEIRAALAGGPQDVMQLIAASHVGNTTEEFASIVAEWMASARHPVTKQRYDEMVYQPMLELLAYLRANGYKTYIVSGGGVEFMRPWVERVYGIPPEQVVGSRVKVKYEVRAGTPVLSRLPAVDLNDDRDGKPVGIHQVIGRRPTMAFGNSDGDFEMLEWTTSAKGPRLGAIVHHTDAEREWAYDRQSPIGRLVRALDEGPKRGWIVVDMRKDWKVIYPFQR